MKFRHLVLLLGLLTGGVAQAQNSSEVQTDYRAVPSLRQHLPLNVPEATNLQESERNDIECLAWNLYFEVRGGTKEEQIAVAFVPMNRMNLPEFGKTICENVFQYGWAGGRRAYQFSWAGIVRGKGWKREDDAWENMQRLAVLVYQGKIHDNANATYFHWAGLQSWAPNYRKKKIGSHVFWRR